MKKFSFVYLSFLILQAMTITAMAQSFSVKLQESFEQGEIPQSWSQEYVVGNHPWSVETLADYNYPGEQIPDVHGNKGGTYRAYLRNTSGQSEGYKTRLVTPALDLTEVYRPILCFYHAQDKWTADFDTLRVYYRTGPNSNWVLLSDAETGNKAEFTQAIRSWKAESYELPLYNSKSYQIAFEGTDNLGRGIVLDSIVVRSYPECIVPYDVTVSNVMNGNATLLWKASWEAEQYHIVLTTTEVDIDRLSELDNTVIAFDSIINYTGTWKANITGLRPNTTYYTYIQSICEKENSAWSLPVSFTMSFRETIPYTETFNIKYVSDQPEDRRLTSWSWGGTNPPVINVNRPDYFSIYSLHNDPAVMFDGTYTDVNGRFTTPLRAGATAYIATPELTGESLKDCQVRFIATVAQRAFVNSYATSIIVGVATNPEDITTFVPVDTVKIWKKDAIEEFTVSLANYSGNGTSVFFMSAFNKPNQFYIDQVTIEKRHEHRMVDYQTFDLRPDTTGFTINLETPAANVVSYNIVVAKQLTRNGQLVSTTSEVANTSFTQLPAHISGLQPWTEYEVAVQAVYADGKADWSMARKFTTSAIKTLPFTFGFESSEGAYSFKDNNNQEVFLPSNTMIFTTGNNTPHNVVTSANIPTKQAQALFMHNDYGNETWIVFPMVNDIKNSQITFYQSSGTEANRDYCIVELGVMTSPADIRTFEVVGQYNAGAKLQRQYGHFQSYTGDGKFIALRCKNIPGKTYTQAIIDNVAIGELVDCPIVTNINVRRTTENSITISWSQDKASQWNVKASTTFIDDELISNPAFMADTYNGTCDNNEVTITGLSDATVYYLYVQPVCHGQANEWSSSQVATTRCKDKYSLPYIEDFERWDAGQGMMPLCFTPSYMSSITTYPYIVDVNSGFSYSKPKDGIHIFNMNASSFYGATFSLPTLDADLDTTVVSFKAMKTNSFPTANVYVGYITTLGNAESFVAVDSAQINVNNQWNEYFITLDGTNIPNDAYLSFSTFSGSDRNSGIYIDDIAVKSSACQTPTVTVEDVYDKQMTITWKGSLSASSEGWEYIVTTTELTDPLSATPEQIIAHAVTKDKSVTLTGLTPNTTCHIYVRAKCGSGEWAYQRAMTDCGIIDAMQRVVIDFESVAGTTSAASGKAPDCWTVGNMKSTNKTYIPYVYKSTSYAHSGTNSLRLYASSTYRPAYAITPLIAIDDMSTISLKFYMYASSTSYRLIIGTVDSPDDLSSFQMIDSVKVSATSRKIYYEIPFEGKYKGNGKYICFRTAYNQAPTLYIDDILVDGAPCYTPQPQMSDITDNSVVVTAGLTKPTEWIYCVTDKSVTDAQLLSGFMVDETSGKLVMKDATTINVLAVDTMPYSRESVIITGLEAGSKYYMNVAALCSRKDESDPGSIDLVSNWTHTMFQTQCTAVTSFYDGFETYAPYSGNFAGAEGNCWYAGNASSTTVSYIPYVNENSAAYKGTKELSIYQDANNKGSYLIAPAIDTDDISKYQVRFAKKGSDYSGAVDMLKVGIITDPYDLSTIVILDTVQLTPNYEFCAVQFDNYKGDYNGNKGKNVIFYSDFDGNNNIYIDEVNIEPTPECRIPGKLTAKDITAESAAISWKGNSPKYRVVVTSAPVADTTLNKGGAIRNLVIDTIVNQTSVSITGLQPKTPYYVHVAGFCGSTQNDFSYQQLKFISDCLDKWSIPFEANFDKQQTIGWGNGVDCFFSEYATKNKGVFTISHDYPYVNSDDSWSQNSHSKPNSVNMYAYNTSYSLLVTPVLDVEDISTLQLSVWAKTGTYNSTDCTLSIGVIADEVDSAMTENFVLLAKHIVPPTNEYTNILVNFDTLQFGIYSGAKRVALLSEGAQLYLDDIIIRPIPSCFEPLKPGVSNISYNDVTISFNPGKENDTMWEVQLILLDDKGIAVDTTYQTIDSTEAKLTGLLASSRYKAKVRTICSADEKSGWSSEIEFFTAYLINNFRWDFNMSSGAELVPYSNSSSYNQFYIHPSLVSGWTGIKDSYYEGSNHPHIVENSVSSYSTRIYAATEDANDGALEMICSPNTSSSDSSYIILPSMSSYTGKQLSFDMRAAYANSSKASYDAGRVNEAYPNAELMIGTVNEDGDISSFQLLKKAYPNRLAIRDSVYAAINFGFQHFVMQLPDMTGRRVAIMLGVRNNSRIWIDNLAIEETQGFTTPQISNLTSTHNSVTVKWEAEGSTDWNVFLLDQNAYMPDTTAHLIKAANNISSTEYTFSDLEENTRYFIYLQIAGKGDTPGITSISAPVKTTCASIAPKLFTFEPDGEWGAMYNKTTYSVDSYIEQAGFYYIYKQCSTSAYDTTYKAPDCWSPMLGDQNLYGSDYGNYSSYIPRLYNNTSSKRYSLSDDWALGLQVTTESFKDMSAISLPNISFPETEDMEMVMYIRCFDENASGKPSNTSFLGSAYSRQLAVGYVSSPEDFNSFVAIDTITYEYTSKEINTQTTMGSDPNGLRYFQKCIIPLKKNTKGFLAIRMIGMALVYIDDISFQARTTPLAPRDLKVVESGQTTTTVGWRSREEGSTFIIQLCADATFSTIMKEDTVTVSSNTFTFNNLSPNTTYYWRIKQISTGLGNSEFAHYASFRTDCSYADLTLATSFECTVDDPAEQIEGSTDAQMKKNQCWTYGITDNFTGIPGAYSYPYNIANTTSGNYHSYAHTGTYGLKLIHTYRSYVATPYIDVDLKTIAVNFYMSPVPHGVGKGSYINKVSAAWAVSNSATIEVGTCTDPNDPGTFVVIDTITYNRYTQPELKLNATANAENDYCFQHFTVNLEGAVGQYIFFRAIVDPDIKHNGTTACTMSTVYLDDITLGSQVHCDGPQSIEVSDINQTSATISWEKTDAKDYTLQIAANATFESKSVVIDSTITDTSFIANSLSAATTYYARVKQTCAEGTSAWSNIVAFNTAYLPPYQEQFVNENAQSTGWNMYSEFANNVFNGTKMNVGLATSDSTGWYKAEYDNGLPGTHYSVRTFKQTANWWLVSPAIILDSEQTALLSFDLNYSQYVSAADWQRLHTFNSIDKYTEGLTGSDDQFMVVISDDGGKTWKRENAIVWNNETTNNAADNAYHYGKGDYVLNNISFLNGEVSDNDKIRIDLSKYQGKLIKIGFYMESTVANTNNSIHIGRVRVNYVNTIEENITLCQYEDYASSAIKELFIDGDHTSAGENVLETFSISETANDTLYSLKANVLEAPVVMLGEVNICEGEVFNDAGFEGLKTSGEYKKKSVCANTGCDSITIVRINVLPRVYSNIEVNLCQGKTYEFGGNVLNRTGIYRDTTSSAIGCDSITVLALTYNPAIEKQLNLTLCHGSTYIFGDTAITSSGTYQRLIPAATANDCDTLATLNINVLDKQEEIINDFFCPGSVYQKYGFNVSKPGTYEQTGMQSIDGCDSTVILNLQYYSMDTTTVERTITTEELPFTFEGITYDESTQPGVYTDTVNIKGEGCDAVVILTLTVNPSTGLEYVTGSALTFAPSYIHRNESVSVMGKFTNAQMEGIIINVYDMTGRCISTLMPKLQPLTISHFPVEGVYSVQILTGDGQTFTGRVIVR